jgi:competence protein ComEC
VAVPLSGIILYGELLLLALFFIPALASLLGKALEWLLWLMNDFIERVNLLPFSVWEGIQINIPQAILLYIVIAGLAIWLLQKSKLPLITALVGIIGFIGIRSVDFMQKERQQKLIVYNVPKHSSVDVIEGRKYQFIGDTILTQDGFLKNFHLKPSRILHRVTPTGLLQNISIHSNTITSSNKRVLILNKSFKPVINDKKIKVDAIIITQDPQLYLTNLVNIFDCKQYIFDASNSLWRIKKWKKEAENLPLRLHSVPEQGAFIMDL